MPTREVDGYIAASKCPARSHDWKWIISGNPGCRKDWRRRNTLSSRRANAGRYRLASSILSNGQITGPSLDMKHPVTEKQA